MTRLAVCAAAACLGWTATALRPTKIDPQSDFVHDPSMCFKMDMPPSMTLLQTDSLVDPDPTFAKLDDKPDRAEIEEVADFHLHSRNDASDFLHLQNRNILFMGDSTVEELMWDTIFTLNETAADDEGWVDVPADQCHYQKCADICGGRDQAFPHQHLHLKGRCSHTGTPACMATMPRVQQLNATFSFLWAASPYVCCNGYPGLYGALHNPLWMDAFNVLAAKGPYDDIIISTGTHDFYGGVNQTQYRIALSTLLGMLDPIGKSKVMVNPQGGLPNGINKEIISASYPSWRIIDRIHWHEHLHCNKVNYTLSYFHYRRSEECHGLVQEIFNPRQ